MQETNFPWILSNIRDKETNDYLSGIKPYVITEKGGFKIGIFGLACEDWFEVLKPFAR